VGYGCVYRRGEQGVRKLEAEEAAVLEDLLGEETTTRQAARIVILPEFAGLAGAKQ
jgi:hypothetical protein